MPSRYRISIFVISLFGYPLPWMPGAVARIAPSLCTPQTGGHEKLIPAADSFNV